LRRRIPSKIFNRVAGWMSGLRLHDMNCGLKAYRAEVVHNLVLYGEPTLEKALKSVGSLWQARTGTRVNVFVAPTDLSYAQIDRGARCDVIFALAGTATEEAARAKIIHGATISRALRNGLVLVGTEGAAGDRCDANRGDGPDAGGDHRQTQCQQPCGGFVHQVLSGHRAMHVRRHHAEIDTADLGCGDRHLERTDADQAPPPIVRSQPAHPAVICSRTLAGSCQNLVDQVWCLAGINRGQPASLHGRADQPGAATPARFQMGVDLLREHLGTLAVQSRGKRLTRNLTPHPCIVAHAWSTRKGHVRPLHIG